MNAIDTSTTASVAALAGKYLTFRLGQESYAVHVLRIREILRSATLTAVPEMPVHVRGVINLRGGIIPVLDLRLRFGLPAAEAEQNCIVVATVNTEAGKLTTMGFLVDGVEEVVLLAPSDLEPTPEFGSQVRVEYLLAMAKVKGRVKGLLDLDRVVSG